MIIEKILAQRTQNMKASIIREILKVVSQPGMVSLAGGIPSPESFPVDIFQKLMVNVTQNYPEKAFQYGTTEGFYPLREEIAKRLMKDGIKSTAEEILISSGSQGVLDAVAKILINKGDKIAIEAPTYLGALTAFNPYEPQYTELETDEEGVVPESLRDVLKNNRIKFIYLVPTFQNPTGKTIPLERRMEIAIILKEFDALLIEDNPYSELRYRGKPLPAIKSFAPDHVIYISTLSKVFAPGLRIGYSAAPEEIQKWLVMAKQGVDLHTSSLNQALAAEYISGNYMDRQIEKIIKLYKPKQEAMIHALTEYMPDCFHWTNPEGGMFLWGEGPKGLNMEEIYHRSVEKAKVAFVPGSPFFASENRGKETLRLNYTMADCETIDRSIKKLSEVFKEFI